MKNSVEKMYVDVWAYKGLTDIKMLSWSGNSTVKTLFFF